MDRKEDIKERSRKVGRGRAEKQRFRRERRKGMEKGDAWKRRRGNIKENKGEKKWVKGVEGERT